MGGDRAVVQGRVASSSCQHLGRGTHLDCRPEKMQPPHPRPKAPILLWPHEKGLWRSQTAVSQQQPGTTKLRFRVTGTLKLSKEAINLDGDAQFPEKKNTLHNPN